MQTESKIVEKGPSLPHVCRPGYRFVTVTEEEASQPHPSGLPLIAGTFVVDDLEQRDSPPGTVVECDCGKTWVHLPDRWVDNGRMMWHKTNNWRPERKRERRKRMRRG